MFSYWTRSFVVFQTILREIYCLACCWPLFVLTLIPKRSEIARFVFVVLAAKYIFKRCWYYGHTQNLLWTLFCSASVYSKNIKTSAKRQHTLSPHYKIIFIQSFFERLRKYIRTFYDVRTRTLKSISI